MIQVKNLHLMHKKDLRPILENFSFALNPGDKAVVAADNEVLNEVRQVFRSL